MGLGRDELLALHDACVAARRRILDAALRELPQAQVMRAAGELGLPAADELAQVPEEDLAYALDVALHRGAPGRARPLDLVTRRLARRAQGEALLVLRALETTWFSAFRVLGPHPEAGLLLEDAVLGGEAWVLDGVLETQGEPGTVVAARLGRVQGFCLTSGVAAALDEAMLAALQAAAGGSGFEPAEMMADPRIALLAYRHAIGLGVRDLLGGR
ncbi:MAG: hypothetical protein K2X74_09440 [Acetobacteraceae bacterium]|nr:hypothetical protein [Acetobacteraceae bacterium]